MIDFVYTNYSENIYPNDQQLKLHYYMFVYPSINRTLQSGCWLSRINRFEKRVCGRGPMSCTHGSNVAHSRNKQ